MLFPLCTSKPDSVKTVSTFDYYPVVEESRMKQAAVSQIVFEAAHMHAINFQSFLCRPFCARVRTMPPLPFHAMRAHTMESDKKWRQSDDPPPSSGWRAATAADADVMIYVANL